MRCKPYDNTRNKLLTGRMKIKGKEYTLDLIERSGEILLSKNNFNDVRNVINSIQNYAQAKYKLPNSIQLFSLEDAKKFKNQGYKALFLNKKSFEQLEKYMDRYEEAKIKIQNQVKEDPKFERDLEFFNQDIALLEQEQRELDQFRDEVENNLDNYSAVVTEEGKEFDTEDINDYKNAYVEYFTYKNALLNQNKKYLFDVSVEINKTDDPIKKAELIDIKQELRDAIYGNESKNIVGLINEMSELEENKKIYNELLEKREKLEISLKKLEDEGLDTSFVLEALKDIAIDLYKFKNENLTSILRANSLSDLSRAEKLIETNKLENLVKAKQIINFYISVNPNNQDVNNPYYSREELLSGKIDSSIIQELYDISNKAASLKNKINNSSRKSIINYINSLEYFTKANENKPYTEEEIFNDKSGLLDISLIDQMVFNIQDNPFSKVQSILQTAIFKNVRNYR